VTRIVRFTKMAGSGNDFVVGDNRDGALAPAETAACARAVGPRARAGGADGVLLLEPSSSADFRMRIFNADGSEPAMCGNGGRCLALFAADLGLATDGRLRIETLAGPVAARMTAPGRVRIELTPPSEIVAHPALSLVGGAADVHLVNTGVPHAVVFVEGLEAVDVRTLGRALRNHPAFAPEGANADFVEPDGSGGVRLRTYERGVEDETLACGTGAVAAALVAAHTRSLSSPVRVIPRSGEEMLVHFTGRGPRFAKAELEGPVSVTFRGEVGFPEARA